jgi:hypothetical protein
MLDSEALSSIDVEPHLGVPTREAHRVLKQRVDQGDNTPLKIHGTWLAPLSWWREVLTDDGLTPQQSQASS